jgi:nicotinate phosphoribosyltransferase
MLIKSGGFQPIIQSLLETDLYKLTMWQIMLHRHPETHAVYSFLCRNKTAYPLSCLQSEVEEQIEYLCNLRFTQDELAYLGQLRFIKSDFIDYLRIFTFQRDFISIRTEGPHLRIEASGPQIHIMGFEIYVLAIVNELYFRRFDPQQALSEGRKRLQEKIRFLQAFEKDDHYRHPFELFDFGIRRRFSGSWQREMLRTLHQAFPQYIKGSSNVYLAKALELTPIGTMAHEYLQSYQAHGVRLRHFQKMALEDWVQEYRGDLGIALTDVVGMDAFLTDFDLYFAKLFDGLRHDSGDPIVWGEKALAHYAKLGIDPHTKRLVFSDGLTLANAIEIYQYFANRTQLGFGIGTYLSNDMGIPALNIVMKLTHCNGQAVAKLSDNPRKTMCEDKAFLTYLQEVFNHKLTI